jgi:hypothetical protein
VETAAEYLHRELRVLETKLGMLGRRNDPASRALRDELNRRREATLSNIRRLENPPPPIYDPPK